MAERFQPSKNHLIFNIVNNSYHFIFPGLVKLVNLFDVTVNNCVCGMPSSIYDGVTSIIFPGLDCASFSRDPVQEKVLMINCKKVAEIFAHQHFSFRPAL